MPLMPSGNSSSSEDEGALEAVDAGDAVTDLDHGADGACLDAGVELVDGGLDDLGDVVGADGHGVVVPLGCGVRWRWWRARSRSRSRRPRTEPSMSRSPRRTWTPPRSSGSSSGCSSTRLPVMRREALAGGPRLSRGLERRGRGDGGLDDALAPAVEAAELADDGGQQLEPAAPDEQRQQVARRAA